MRWVTNPEGQEGKHCRRGCSGRSSNLLCSKWELIFKRRKAVCSYYFFCLFVFCLSTSSFVLFCIWEVLCNLLCSLKSWFVKNIAKQSVSDIIVCTCIFILLFHVLVILNWPMIVDLAWVFFLIKQSKSHLASNCNNLILRLYLEIHIQLFFLVHREEISYYQFIEKFRCQNIAGCWLASEYSWSICFWCDMGLTLLLAHQKNMK